MAKRTGQPCQRTAMANGRCMMHGGKTPRGIASPHFKTGEWCKDLPARLQAKAAEANADPELLSQKKAVAILEARFWDVMASTSNQESGELWENLHKAKQQYYKAAGRDAEEQRKAALQDIWYLITEGYNERQAWREMRDILQDMRAIKESERKRLVDMQQMLSVSQANILLGAVAHAIKTHVHDKATLQALSTELAALVNHGA